MDLKEHFSIANYVRDSFDGMLIFGDIHGDFQSFKRARDFAVGENFFFMSAGDLVDRGRNPYEIVESMYNLMYPYGRAGMTIGNHDDKHIRRIKGNKVSLSRDAEQTLSDVGPDRLEEFERMYTAVVEDKLLARLYHKFGDITLVHAAGHPMLWEEGEKEIGKSARSRFLVGETNGEKYEDGYPVRLYNWIEEIPAGKTLIVGHDKQPIHNVPISEPMHVTNSNGGKVIFIDTGCGKGGFLSGVIILHDKKGFKIDKFVEFK